MTDDFSKEERETVIPEDDFTVEDNEVPAEDWQEPPTQDDGFSDPEIIPDDLEQAAEMQEEMLEDSGLSGDVEEYEEYEEEGEEVDSPRRGKGVLFAALGVGLLLVAGGGYMYFSAGEPGQAPTPENNVVAPQPVAAPVSPKANAAQMADVSPTTGEADLSLLYRADGVPTSTEAVALPEEIMLSEEKGKLKVVAGSTDVIVSDEPIAPVPKTMPVMPSLPAKDVGGLKGADAAKKEVSPQIAKIEDLPVKPQAEMPLPQVKPVETVNVDGGKLKALEEELVEIKAANKALKKEVAALKDKKPAVSSDDGAALSKAQATLLAREGALKTAKKKLAALEGKNQDLKHENKGLRKKLKAARRQAKRVKKAVQKAVAKKKKTSARKNIIVPNQAAKMLEPPANMEVPSSSKRVVLRAATPDAVWVATTKSDPKLQRAVVGDEIPGFGRIVTIRQRAGKWEVVGTKGTLR